MASCELDACFGAPEPHGFAVRKTARSSVALLASTASHPTFVTIASRPSWQGGMARAKHIVLKNGSKKFWARQDRRSPLTPLANFAFARTRCFVLVSVPSRWIAATFARRANQSRGEARKWLRRSAFLSGWLRRPAAAVPQTRTPMHRIGYRAGWRGISERYRHRNSPSVPVWTAAAQASI